MPWCSEVAELRLCNQSRVAFALLLALVAACDRRSSAPITPVSPTPTGEAVSPASPPTTPTIAPPPPLVEAVLVGAGDIAECGQQGAVQTAALLDGIPGTVFTAGDNVYMNGTPKEFECYDATWGRRRNRTYPATGNHDYGTPDASGYFQYFGERAGPMGQGYYAFEAGAWHVVSLNSNVGWREGSAQMQWLRHDLQPGQGPVRRGDHAPPAGQLGAQRRQPARPQSLARASGGGRRHRRRCARSHLRAPHADESRNSHHYPRGMRLFTVGTGGARVYHIAGTRPTTEAKATVWGVIRFVLLPGSYRWEFRSVEGILDSGLDASGDQGRETPRRGVRTASRPRGRTTDCRPRRSREELCSAPWLNSATVERPGAGAQRTPSGTEDAACGRTYASPDSEDACDPFVSAPASRSGPSLTGDGRPISYTLRNAHFFGGTPGPTREILQSGAFTPSSIATECLKRWHAPGLLMPAARRKSRTILDKWLACSR